MRPDKNRSGRRERGNLYLLYIFLIAFLITIFHQGAQLCLGSINAFRTKVALEAAALAAANDLSRIVINDPYWGYVALTDHAPVGAATLAGDSEPLPVSGINTLIGTARHELMVAKAIGTDEAFECARADLEAARKTARDLEDHLRNILSSPLESGEDMDGNKISPLKSAEAILKKNLADNLALKDLPADLGYLSRPSTTNSPMPADRSLAEIDKSYKSSRYYPAFVDLPLAGESFYFAGLGEQSSLVDEHQFRHGNGEQICSILKLKARFRESGKDQDQEARACAQPFYQMDRTKPGLFCLSFPRGKPASLNRLRDLFTERTLLNKIGLNTATGGDYPLDVEAKLETDKDQAESTLRYASTRAYFDWLRQARMPFAPDQVIADIDRKLAARKDTNSRLFVLLYGFSDDGAVKVLTPSKVPFRRQSTQENQLYAISFGAFSDSGMNWTFKLRNQVRRLGTIHGGKHAGQAMPSIDYIDELNTLSVREASVDKDNRFASRAGSRYDQSRLAVEIEISS
ncbi:MAG TPA: hypothetical protein PKD05_12565 [Candidatus Melainabacteria bacterium]|nr:hypothetical protein [Candidatus Melainabacteria bacterium]